MKPLSSSVTLAVSALIAAILLTACNSSEAVPTGPFKAEFENAKRQASSDFERSVLKDAKISRAEYEEAVNRFVECLKDSGIEAEAIPGAKGSYQYRWPKAQADEKVESTCRAGSTKLIEPLYNEMLVNPKNEDPFEVMVRCLSRESLVPAEYTADDLKADMKSNYTRAPFDRNNPKVTACLTGDQ